METGAVTVTVFHKGEVILETFKQSAPYRWVTRRMAAWLEERVPPVREKTLGYRSIFIFPSLAGFFFIGLLAVILLAAINYQNNMLYGFVFLLGSIFAVSIFHCYRNLSGLKVAFIRAPDAFAGDMGAFRYVLSQSPGSETRSLSLQWPLQGPATFVPRVASEPLEVTVYHQINQRGHFKPGRLLVQTAYPLGLIRAWSQLDLQASIVVYPRPLVAPVYQPQGEGGEREGSARLHPGQDDYQGLRTYQPGDSLRQIAWKQYAQKGDFYTKDFSVPVGDSIWLDLRDYPGAELEEKLSYLCDRVLELCKTQSSFGLRLADQEVAPGSGEEHRVACLRALALFRGEPAQVHVERIQEGRDSRWGVRSGQ